MPTKENGAQSSTETAYNLVRFPVEGEPAWRHNVYFCLCADKIPILRLREIQSDNKSFILCCKSRDMFIDKAGGQMCEDYTNKDSKN